MHTDGRTARRPEKGYAADLHAVAAVRASDGADNTLAAVLGARQTAQSRVKKGEDPFALAPLLPSFFLTRHFSYARSQLHLALIKFIEKKMASALPNIFTMKIYSMMKNISIN